MNNIYKVIWSKAKNCYVVASEIARSHTKSATGSGKIGGVARHALLALGAACAIACGGFVNVGAYESVDVTTTGGSNAKVYTADATDSLVHDKVETGIRSELNYYYKKSDVDAKLEALTTTGDVATNKNNINDLKTKAVTTDATLTDLSGRMTTAENNITNLKDADVRLEGKIDQNTHDITGLKDKDTELSGKIDTETANRITSDTALDHKIDAEIANRITSDTALDHKIDAEIANRITSDTALDQKIDKEIQDRENAINATDDRTGGIARNLEDTQTTIEGIVKVDNQGNVKDVKGLSAETINTTGDATIGGKLGVTGETTLNDKLTAKGEATFEKNVTVEKDLTVNGKLNVGEIYLENNKLDAATGEKHDSATAITADGISNLAKVTEHGNTTESQFTHNKKGTINYAKVENSTGDWKVSTSKVTADGVSNKMTDSDGNTHTYSQTATESKEQLVNGDKSNFEKKTAEGNTISIKDKDADGNLKSLTNKQTVDGEKTSVTNNESSSTINQGADQIRHNVTFAGKESSIEVKADGITNTSKDGTITNDAKDIVNKATGNMTNTVGGDLTTTVGGNELHKVTGKQTNTVGGGQENIISGGQINNITGDQTTTITGKKTETVTENVTEDYKKDLTTTVGGNEIHEVKGTKKETVEGKVTENFKGGQETNVTGDQTTNVSGTQTTNATDIKRNASSGMIDTIDNDYGTNTETKVAGKTTTDVIIKGTGEKGQYIRGANESRDYLIKGTLKNSETKTVEKTSTEITDGTNKASTIQDAKNLAGSVTNGTETGVSGIHANDDGSVSIDSGVTDGTNTSVQKQTASAIAAAVKDGAGNVNASVANATTSANTITNGTKTNTVISTVDGTSFINSEANTAFEGGTYTDTTIKGNTITTGEVTMDYAKVMRDLGVNGNANIEGKTTTGSLEVKGESKLTGKVTMESDATVGGTLDVTKKATFHDDVDITKNLSVGGNATIRGDVTANSYKVGDKTYISAAGINANDQKITNVADGSISEGSKDAVNGGQLYGVKRDLEHQVDKVGANAAAMANLRPMEFDPSSKWNIAAAIGNYGSETAAAIGAFYRPNDNVMVNLSTAFGTGENMVGGGVSVRLGKGGNKLSREETNALKAQVADLSARMDALLSVLNPNMSKDFPDVPENHWAYEAVSRLAGNDIVQGYPDGEFHGERTMTRYEMAEIIYNALSRGAEAERELVEEFKPELQAMAASEKATAEKAEG